MRRIVLSLVVIIGVALGASGSAVAGGWATARLDEPVLNVTVGVPFAFGFTVRAHDIHPFNPSRAVVSARPQDGGPPLTAEAKQEGDTGHFLAQLTLTAAGGWKWGVETDEYGALPFETLTVAEKGAAASTAKPSAGKSLRTPEQAILASGRCGDSDLATKLGVAAMPLSRVAAPAAAIAPVPLSSNPDDPTHVPVDRGASTMALPLIEIETNPHALLVLGDGPKTEPPIACGDVAGSAVDGELAVGLAEQEDSGYAGLGLLRREGEQTVVSVYAMPIDPDRGPAPVEVRISDVGFSPPTLSVPAGTTIVWRNEGQIVHSLIGADLVFADSTLLEPDQTFSQTFAAPGTYAYACGPHAFMTGTVTVE